MVCCHGNGLYQNKCQQINKPKYVGILTGKFREQKLQDKKIRLYFVTPDSFGKTSGELEPP